MPRQLTLDLPVRTALGRADFFVSPANAAALALVEGWANWPLGKLVVTGAPGSGKTHLAHVFAAQSGGRVISDIDDPDGQASGPLAVDGADAVAEAALFHLHNLMAERGHPLLLAATEAPARWSTALPDLRSRLEAAPVARLEAPDDDLLAAVLAKHFADRQVVPRPDVIPYLVSHMERSLDVAAQVVASLDQAALADKRPVTRKLAVRLLDNDGPEGA